jgi:hypothetical protein
LQVHKPASADLINSQFTKNWREIHPNFLPGLLTQARGIPNPQARIGRASAFLFNSTCAQAPNAHLSTQKAAHSNQKFAL